MSIPANVSLAFLKLPGSDKVTFGKNVYNCLTASPDEFPNLPYDPKILLGSTDALSAGEAAALNGDKTALDKLITIKKLWNSQFKTTANFISVLADGRIDFIKLAGFLPTKTTRQSATVSNAVTGFTATVVPTEKGTAEAGCDPVKRGSRGYVYVAAPEGVKISMENNMLLIDVNGVQVYVKADTQSSTLLTNLLSGSKINVNMYTFNAAGSSALTDPQFVFPQ